jgi:lipoprotein-anchoring transpeptidase ErfK/SrfK
MTVGALLLSGCGGATPKAQNKAPRHPPLRITFPTNSTPVQSSGGEPTQPPAGSVFVATSTVPSLPVYATPRALRPEQAIANPNPLGAPLTLLVNAVERGWLQVYLPERPNEDTGWVSETNTTMATDAYHIVVSLSARQVTLYHDGAKVLTDSAAVGEPSSPTPTGHFFVTEDLQLTDPSGPYGPYALGLSGFSNTYYSFEGGPGQIAIHGTDQPWVIGGYASHGCVRLSNPDIAALVQQVPAGTPVDIVN